MDEVKNVYLRFKAEKPEMLSLANKMKEFIHRAERVMEIRPRCQEEMHDLLNVGIDLKQLGKEILDVNPVVEVFSAGWPEERVNSVKGLGKVANVLLEQHAVMNR